MAQSPGFARRWQVVSGGSVWYRYARRDLTVFMVGPFCRRSGQLLWPVGRPLRDFSLSFYLSLSLCPLSPRPGQRRSAFVVGLLEPLLYGS
jgi:hypothetical protein